MNNSSFSVTLKGHTGGVIFKKKTHLQLI